MLTCKKSWDGFFCVQNYHCGREGNALICERTPIQTVHTGIHTIVNLFIRK